jgi:cytoskeletal protein RodZ
MTSKLKEARVAAGYSIDYVADKLNIRKQYIIALEERDYESIPGKIYIDGYTKMYYELLGIDLQSQQNDDLLLANKTQNSVNKDVGGNKYKKYIIIFSVILLTLVVMLFNFLKKSQNDIPFLTIQTNYLNYGSEQENFDESDNAD